MGESGAKGCEVVVSGKLRGQRAKSMKFTDGLMIHSGEPRRHYVDTAVRHVHLRQGVLGIKVKIMFHGIHQVRMVPALHFLITSTSLNPRMKSFLQNHIQKTRWKRLLYLLLLHLLQHLSYK